jgi:cytochrome c oxidase assembly protein subunit 15
MPKHNKKLVAFTTLLAFCVVVFGAYVRLSDAGLGCPDWPGCYGYFGPPSSPSELADTEELFPDQPFNSTKAWTEMVHRYLATTLGFFNSYFVLFRYQKQV